MLLIAPGRLRSSFYTLANARRTLRLPAVKWQWLASSALRQRARSSRLSIQRWMRHPDRVLWRPRRTTLFITSLLCFSSAPRCLFFSSF